MRVASRSFAALVVALLGVPPGGCHPHAVRRNPSAEAELPAITAEELFQIGLLQARRGDLLRAEQYLIASRDRGHDESTVVYWLVRVCVSSGRYHSALGHAAEYLQANPSDWRLRLVVASIYEALGDLEQARVELQRIVDAEPTRPLPRYRLAMVFRQAAEHVHAAPHLRAYLDLDPRGPHASAVRAMLDESLDIASRTGSGLQPIAMPPKDRRSR